MYCIDNGLVYATNIQFSENSGKLFENLVYSELCKKHLQEVYHFNEQKECDFIIRNQQELLAIQVCYNLTLENRKREVNGLKSALEKFNIQKGIIVTYDQEEVIEDRIQVIPFWKWASE